MKFLTKNQVINTLKKIADNHLQINSSGYGDKKEIETSVILKNETAKGISTPAKTPFMWVTPMIGRVTGGSIFYDFDIIIGDSIKKDESNEWEAESDTMLICLDILSKLDDDSYGWALTKESSIQPFSEKWDSEYTGHIMSVSLEFMFNYDYCQAPFATPDADVAAFLTATGIEDEAQINAITTLVEELKENGLWNRMHAIYPFIGGTANTHSYNLKNPDQYQILWSPTGVTHNANGITGNGTTGYGDTQYLIQAANQNNLHLSVYVRNEVVSKCAIGCLNNGAVIFSQIYPNFNVTNLFEASINQASSTTATNIPQKGFYFANRGSTVSISGYKNTTEVINLNATSMIPPNKSLTILARNGNTVNDFSTFNLSFASIGESLTSIDESIYYSIIQQYQTTIGRSV